MKLLRADRKLTPSWDLVQPAIRLAKDNIWPLFYLSFLPSLVTTIGLVVAEQAAALGASHQPHQMTIGYTVAALGALVSLLLYPSAIYLQLRAIRGEQPDVLECIRHGLPRLLPFLSMIIIAGLAITAGIICFIVPGILLLRGFYLASYYVVDQKIGPVQALKQCYRESKPVSGYIWGTAAVGIVFEIAGISLQSIPVAGRLLALASVYLYIFVPALRYKEIADTANLPVKANKAAAA